jgi:hypothetical protein
MVRNLAACGVEQEHIAARIGIRSPKTLRKHFRKELDLSAVDANMRVAQSLLKMATSGSHPSAAMLWLKARAGWREHGGFEPSTAAPAAFVVAREPGGPTL